MIIIIGNAFTIDSSTPTLTGNLNERSIDQMVEIIQPKNTKRSKASVVPVSTDLQRTQRQVGYFPVRN
jgi:hypothetical protein